MDALRMWLFRSLILVVAGMLILSVYLPWWSAKVQLVVTPASGLESFKVMLYQHGIPTTAGAEYFQTDVTPPSQVKLAWGYAGLSTALLLAGSIPKGKWGRWLIGITSLGYIVYTAGALVLMSQRTAVYGVPLMGQTVLAKQNGEIVKTGFLTGYYLAYISGALGLVLAVFRDKITGIKKLVKLKEQNVTQLA
jgi:hypothetical protein